ncbi:hypothetical protein CTEN210_14819 [Chaetoceros tenuissimus]|uniref:Uncharacterized protein n=1 Tax=Chaetoceros tenuissimus TaxID=426638 RepID=A0AAD3D5U7_9STRA|nr:hypothetical protein CTEN210_14819 [Chaetoceros tenuissimus]
MVHWIDTRDKSSLVVDTATWIPRVTGSLSIISSGLIIFMMVIDRKWKLTKPNHRILLLMSVFDVISSIAHVMSSSPVPRSLGVVGALGNHQTCSIQAFMLQIGTASILYNASLAYYYLMTVCFQVSKHKFAACFYYEKFCHLFSIGYPLATGIAGIVLNVYGYAGQRCFISKVDHPNYVILFKGWITVTVLAWIIFCNSRIVFEMRKNEKEIAKYTKSIDRIRAVARVQNRRVTGATCRRREAAKQALLYSCSYFITYVFVWIRFLMRPPDGNKFLEPPIVQILMRTFFPMQGFFNLLVYARPELRRIRNRNPNMSLRRALHIMIFAPNSLERRRISVIGTEAGRQSQRSTALAAKMKKALEESRKQSRKVQRTDADGSYMPVTRTNTHLHSSIESGRVAPASSNRDETNVISISITPRKNETETEEECELNNHTNLTEVMADGDVEDGSSSEQNEEFMFDIDLSVGGDEIEDDDSCWSYEMENNDDAVAEKSDIL